ADPAVIRDFFMDPPVEAGMDFTAGKPDGDAVRELLVEEHGFSADRVDSSLEKYLEARAERQSGLDSFI
ncbi:MAG: flap structure-specific endonuclease, partial [Candidatus Nanohaloarchaea archaeon]|nr:flap structure-specific endonuclease [Candidatus Nanohaloarchaea archaeon]